MTVKGTSFSAVELAFVIITLFYTDPANATSTFKFRGVSIGFLRKKDSILCLYILILTAGLVL